MSVALVIQHAMRMRYIVNCGLSGCAVFSTLSHKMHDVRKKVFEIKIRVLNFCKTLFETLLFLRRNERDVIKNLCRSSREVTLFCQIEVNLELSRQSFEKYWNTKFHENPFSGAELFHTDERLDGRTDRQDKANSRFSQFANAPKSKQVLSSTVREQTWF